MVLAGMQIILCKLMNKCQIKTSLSLLKGMYDFVTVNDVDVFKSVINNMPQGFAYHEILCNKDGQPKDYVFLQVNNEFANIIGMDSRNIIGKKASELFLGIREEFDYLAIYGYIAIKGGNKEFTIFIKNLNRWYKVFVYSQERGFFITLFCDVSEEMQLLENKQILITALNDIVVEFDSSYIYRNIWTADEELLFKPRRYLLNRRIDEIFSGELVRSFINAFKQTVKTGQKVIIEYERPSLEEGNRWFQAKIFSRINNMNERKYFANISDITDRKLAEEALKESERFLRESQKAAYIGSIIINIKNQTWNGSSVINKIFGIDETYPRTVKGWNALIHPEWRQKCLQYYLKVEAEKLHYDYEYKIIRLSDGKERWVHGLADLEFDNQSKAVRLIGTFQDITKRKNAEEEIIYLSYHDKLTGLYNRRFYEEEIKRLDTERNLPISIIIGDVNGLKLVNDAFGHDKGDELLQKAATAIQSACRTDDIVARWGGDEFVILLPKTKTEEAERIVKRIKELYSNEYVNALSVSISFGWDTKQKTDQDILKVLKSAEDYMYKHKIIENKGMRSNIISTIINTLHEKNPREEQHSKRVSRICQNIGKAMGFSEIEVSRLKIVGLLHDIGKIAIDEGILNKPRKLTEQERNEIKRHPDIGYRILSKSYDMLELADCILAHHERWDGTGYPKGLKGEAIPRVARIIALADSYDAMTSERPYRNAMSEEEALIEIKKNSGTQFDPEIANYLLK
ncbi:MAG: HD domain-containing phosphohydrolase [Desulfitobacteriaceae bacterium]